MKTLVWDKRHLIIRAIISIHENKHGKFANFKSGGSQYLSELIKLWPLTAPTAIKESGETK